MIIWAAERVGEPGGSSLVGLMDGIVHSKDTHRGKEGLGNLQAWVAGLALVDAY